MTTSAREEDVYAEVLGAFEERADPGEPLTTSEVAAWFDCTRRTVYNRLQHLVACGQLRTKKVGSRARVWWRPPGVDRSRYRSVFHRTDVLLWVLAPEGRLLEANDTALECVDAEREEVLDDLLWETDWWAWSTERRHRLVDAVKEAADGRSVGENLPLDCGRSVVSVDCVVEPLDDGGEVLLAQARPRSSNAFRDGPNQRVEHVTSVFRALGRAVTQVSTRQEVARSLCDSLVDIDPYRWVVAGTFASSFERFDEWATVDGGDGRLTDALESGRSTSLAASLVDAARTGEVRVGRVHPDEATGRWQAVATDAGVRSYAAVPLLAKDAVSGVLGIYATRPDAFEGERRRLVADLGEIVGYALTQTDVLDVTVELEFRSDHLAETFLEHADEGIELQSDAGVSLPDGTSRRYWTVEGTTADEFRTVLEDLPTIRDSRLLRTVGDTTRFEVTVEQDSISTAFGRFDGELHSGTLADGEFRFRGRFPRTADSEHILTEVREVFPDVELLSRRRVLRPASLRHLVEDHLTDRQQTVLELAYSAGYYEQPRQSTGAELAAQLSLTKQTFHHHLRNAEATVFRQVFDSDEPRTI